MSRLVAIVAACITSLIVIVAATVVAIGSEAAHQGFLDYRFRARFMGRFKHADRPLVAWLGDSTIALQPPHVPYPTYVEENLSDTLAIQTFNWSLPGLDQYNHYLVLGRVLSFRPDALFIVANLRLMNTAGSGSPILQLASMIPASELPRASLLPWHARSVTVPRLLLARALDWGPVETAAKLFDGVRKMFRDRLDAVPPSYHALDAAVRYAQAFRRFDTPISAGSPAVEMLSATVDMAVRHGVPTTVIVAPIPIGRLEKAHLYGPRTRQRIEVLRKAVEGAGGHLLDYHAILPAEEFADFTGHYTVEGKHHLADLLSPVVLGQLGYEPPR